MSLIKIYKTYMRIEDFPLSDASKDVFRNCVKRWYDDCVPRVHRVTPLPEEIEWISAHVESIHAAISQLPQAATRRIHLSTLSSILKALDIDNKETSRLLKLAVEESATDGLNKLGSHMADKYLPLESMRARLNQLRDELPRRAAMTEKEKETILKFTALACYTLQPPLRREWGDVQVCADPAVPSAARCKLLVHDEQWHLEIIHDKVMRTKGTATLPISNELKDALQLSFSLFPRRYVLSQNAKPERPLGTAQPFTCLLAKVHSKRKVGVNCYRKAWASTLQGKPDKEWHDMARMMRTSAEKLRSTYLAIDAPTPQDKVVGQTSEGHDVVERVSPESWGKLHLEQQNHWDEARFKEHRHHANRAVLLRDLKMHKRRPQASTLDKYNITWNGKEYV